MDNKTHIDTWAKTLMELIIDSLKDKEANNG